MPASGRRDRLSQAQLRRRGIALSLVFNIRENSHKTYGSHWSEPPGRCKAAKNLQPLHQSEVVPVLILAAGHADSHKRRGLHWSAPQRRNNPNRFRQKAIVPVLSLMTGPLPKIAKIFLP
jgi:hypothetical protein